MHDVRELWLRTRDAVTSFQWNMQAFAIAVLLVLGFVTLFVSQPADPPLILGRLFPGRRLNAFELQAIEAALSEAQLAGHVVEQGELRVPVVDRAKYFSAISLANAMPASFHTPTANALKATSLIDTARSRSERMDHAIENQARLAICALDGIDDAFVHFDAAQARGLRANETISAVAGVRTRPDHPLDYRSVHVIQDMLMGFKVGLTIDEVTVADLTGGLTVRGAIEPDSKIATLLMKKGLEREWKQKLTQVIGFVPESEMAVLVTPSQDPARAETVRVSVSLPSSYVDRLQAVRGSGARAEVEAAARESIQAAILPLIPHNNETANVDELVSVNLFQVVATGELAGWRKRLQSWQDASWISIASFFTAAAALFLLFSASKRSGANVTHDEAEAGATSTPTLRVVGGRDGHQDGQTHDGQNPSTADRDVGSMQTKLRTFVEEDPDAAARSLSDFIDRAS